MALLPHSEVQAFLDGHPSWEASEAEIARTFVFADFSEAMAFVTRTALAAEKADHHPDIDIRWNKVTIGLSTHSEGGITDKDTSLAASLDGIVGG